MLKYRRRAGRILWLAAALLILAALFAGCGKRKEEPAGNPAADEQILSGGMEGDTDGMTVIADELDAEEGAVDPEKEAGTEPEEGAADALTLPEDGSYTSKDEVALYIHLYGHLPDNYISKKEAQKLGWSGGSLAEYAPGKSIGGSGFGNYEGLLPEKKGRRYYECDIDYNGGRRNAKRIVYSNDGLIFYTDDHYNSFEQLY